MPGLDPLRNLVRKTLPDPAVQRLEAFTGRIHIALKNRRWRRGPAGTEFIPRLRALRNAYAGRRCFVIGNGPSLSKTDVALLRNEVTIGCNALFLLFDRMGFLPTFYTVEDVLVAEDRAKWINDIHGTIKIFPHDLAYCLKQDPDTHYINFRREDFTGLPKFTSHFEKVVYWGGTVTYLNLQLAYHIGCSEVYLIGVDHNYTVPPKEQIDREGVIVSQVNDPNHFDPSYFGPGFRWHDPKVDRMERAYQSALRFGRRQGMQIFNATAGGHLEVFPRADYFEVLKRGKGS